MTVILRLLLLLSSLTLQLFAFVAPTTFRLRAPFSSTSSVSLSAEEQDSVDNMRRLLEASWNTETMGEVPTNAESAADTAVSSLSNAVERAATPTFFIDILLPQYDIRQGKNLYDEVLSVQFCISLAHRMKGKSVIVVRDDKTIQTVTRILDARERDNGGGSGNAPEARDKTKAEDKSDVEFYDDFEDFGPVGDTASSRSTESSPISDVDSFRQQLMSDWKGEDDKSVGSGLAKEKETPETKKIRKSSAPKSYRLTSMLGTDIISSGADMMDDVVRAVAANAQPTDDEDTIIILSAVSREEMIGVRSLVSKFEGKKKIVLVNCSLNPLPRELMLAQTVYSIQPLIARPKVSEQNIFGSQSSQDNAPPSPKVVVMRRYPRDWEVFVDLGDGFELAKTLPAGQVDKKGPSMQVIAGCVKAHMESRHG